MPTFYGRCSKAGRCIARTRFERRLNQHKGLPDGGLFCRSAGRFLRTKSKNASALFYDNSRALARNQAVIKRKFFRKLIVIIMINMMIKNDFIYHNSAHNCLS